VLTVVNVVRRPLVLVLGVMLVGLFGFAASAQAHGEEDGDAKAHVLRAIALIVNTPDDHMGIEDHIHDALEAKDHAGVDLTHVRHAEAAFEAGNPRRTRDYLQSAIGAGPFVSNAPPKPIGKVYGRPGEPAYAVGGESGTIVVLDSYRPNSSLNGGDWLMLLLSIAAILAGALLAWRFRPADTIRKLRHTPMDQGGG